MADRPNTTSIKDLSNTIDQAVKIATEKHKINLSPELRIGPAPSSVANSWNRILDSNGLSR
jgi:hypothetical protein